MSPSTDLITAPHAQLILKNVALEKKMQIISVQSVHTANSAGVLTFPANLVLLGTTPAAKALLALMNAQPAGLAPTPIERAALSA